MIHDAGAPSAARRRTRPLLSAAALAAALALLAPGPAVRPQPPEPEALILLSFRIRPYEALAEALQGHLRGYRTRVLCLGEPPALDDAVRKGRPDVILTVGQEALRQALPHRDGTPVVYTMVLSPQGLLPAGSTGVDGVAMLPAPRSQMEVLATGFRFKRVALFYNPGATGFLADIYRQSAPEGFRLEGLPVDSEAALLRRLKEGLKGYDAVVLVPDPTLLTEQGLKALLAASYGDRVPLVGFSPLYLGLGAAVTLSVPEDEVARRAAALAKDHRDGGAEPHGGLYYPKACEVRVNRNALGRLGMKLDEAALRPFGGAKEGAP